MKTHVNTGLNLPTTRRRVESHSIILFIAQHSMTRNQLVVAQRFTYIIGGVKLKLFLLTRDKNEFGTKRGGVVKFVLGSISKLLTWSTAVG